MLVHPAGQAPVFLIHRPSIEARCIQRIPRASECTISLLDPEASRELDRRLGSADPGAPDARGRAPWRASPA